MGGIISRLPHVRSKKSAKIIAASNDSAPDDTLHDVSDVTIDKFLRQVDPLDLLVFVGGDGVSAAITLAEKFQTGSGAISHVELAMTPRFCTKLREITTNSVVGATDDLDTLYSWGSTLSGELNDGVNDAETGKAFFGVQLRRLRDLVREYLRGNNTNVGVCKLRVNPAVARPGETTNRHVRRCDRLRADIDSVYDKYNHTTYDANPLSLLAAMFPAVRPLRDAVAQTAGEPDWLFCSEFVATVYCELGIISDETDGSADGKTLDPRNVLPVDFIGADEDSSGIRRRICGNPIWIR